MTQEATTDRVQLWMEQRDPMELMISDWVVTEFAAALSVKVRLKLLSTEHRARAASLFTRMKTESLAVHFVTRDHFLTAARFADQHATGLRAGDALHVAIAADLGATICTLDKRLAESATTVGVSAELV